MKDQIRNRGEWLNLAFILPYLLVFIAMILIPLVWGISLSFEKVDLFGGGRFVGLANYQRLLSDKIFLQTVGNTLYFVLLTVPALVVLGLFLAIALNKQTWVAASLRGIFFSSTILSVTVVTLLAWLVLAYWEQRLVILGGAAALFALMAMIAIWRASKHAQAGANIFSDSLQALQTDRAALRPPALDAHVSTD